MRILWLHRFGLATQLLEAFPEGVNLKGTVWWQCYASLDQQSV